MIHFRGYVAMQRRILITVGHAWLWVIFRIIFFSPLHSLTLYRVFHPNKLQYFQEGQFHPILTTIWFAINISVQFYIHV